MIENVSDLARYEMELMEIGSRVETLTADFLYKALHSGWTGKSISELRNIPLEVVLAKMNEYGLSVFDTNIRKAKRIGKITPQKESKHVACELMTGDMMGYCQHCGATGPVDIFHLHHTIKYTESEFSTLPKMPPNSRAWDLMLEEIELCNLLCGNCHSNLHSVYESPASLIEISTKPYYELYQPVGIIVDEELEYEQEEIEEEDSTNIIRFPVQGKPRHICGVELTFPC